MRDNGPTVVLLAALLAFFGIRSNSPDEAAAVKNGLKDTQLSAIPWDEKGQNGAGSTPPPSEETFGPAWPSFDFQNTAPGPANVGDPDTLYLDVPGWDTQYLIACVPDPHDSSSGYRFDYLIDAIQLATETQHFVLDRYFYPWSPKKPAFDIQGTLTQKKSDKREMELAALSRPSQSKGRTDPKQWPGVLLFRESPIPRPSIESCLGIWGLFTPTWNLLIPPSPPWPSIAATQLLRSPRLLQVFLVGETATAGIHKRAFSASLDLIGRSAKYKGDHTVRILGPSFSGSQTSLEQTLQTWIGEASGKKIEPPKKITIISGTAMAIDQKRLQASCNPVEVEFHATAIPAEEVLKKTLRYLGVLDDSLTFKYKVAFVGESNTSYGKITSSQLLDGKSKENKSKDGNPEENKPDQIPSPSNENKPAYFPFPLHISEVRSAYQQTSGPTKNDALSLPSFGSKLRLPLASSQPRDVEPPQDHAMSAVAIERILGNMLNTIAGERIPYTIILATDVKDKLFLVTLLRQHCPETRLILSGNDLLFSHPDFSAALRGTIVSSTYPLYLRNQHWSVPAIDADHRHILFPSEEAQGCYNAAIALLNPKDSKSLLEYGPPFPALRTGKGDSYRPPVWVSFVGQGGPIPLTAIPMVPKSASAEYVFQRHKPGDGEWAFRPLHPTLWPVLVLGITILLVYVFFSYFAAMGGRDHKWKSFMGKEMQKLFLPRKDEQGDDGFRWRQRLYTFCCLTSVFVLYAYLTFVWLIPFGYWCVKGKLVEMEGLNLIASIFLASLLLLIEAAFTVLWVIPPPRWSSRRARFSVFCALLPLIMAKSMVLWISGSSLLAPVWGLRSVRVYLCLLTLVILCLLFITLFLALHGVLARPVSQARESFRLPFVGILVDRDRLVLVGIVVNLFLLGFLTYYIAFPERSAERLLFFERATNLTSGISPVVPVFFLAMAFFCWGFVQLKRLSLLESRHAIDNPFPGTDYFDHVNNRHDQIKDYLRSPERALKKTGAWIVLIALSFTFLRLWKCFVPSVEGRLAEFLMLLGLAVLAFLIAYGWLHICRVWKSIRELLDALALLPKSLGEALERLSPSISGMFGPYLSTTRPGWQQELEARLERLKQLAPEDERVKDHLLRSHDLPAAKLLWAMKDPAASIPKLQPDNLCSAAQAYFTLLAHVWSDLALSEKLVEPPIAKPAEIAPAFSPSAVHIEKNVHSEPGPGNPLRIIEDIEPRPNLDTDKLVRDWLRRVQDFVALEVTVYLSQFFVHLRNLILFLAIAPILMLLAVSSYPFQPQRLWLTLAATLIIVVSATIIWIVIQIERNEVVSRILSTTPNRLNFHWHFLGRILIYAAPLLGVVIATSSLASDLIHALVDPLIQALR